MSSEQKKPVLAVDIDEVLAYFIPSLADFHNEAYPNMNLSPDSFFSYDFCKVWGGTMEDSYTKMDEFYQSHHFKENLRPIPHAIEMLQAMKEEYELHVVTSRQYAIQEKTLEWINNHYPNIFTEIHFGNHYSREGKVRSKPEICKDIGAVLLIDDSLQYAYQCHQANIPVILFGEYAWNQKHSVQTTLFNEGDVMITSFHPDTHNVETLVSNTTNTTVPDAMTTTVATSTTTTSSTVDDATTNTALLHRVIDWRHMKHAIEYVLKYHHINTTTTASNTTTSSTLTLSSQVPVQVVTKFNVAAIQMCSTNNKLINLQKINELVIKAVNNSANNLINMICLPECCIFMSTNSTELIEASENIINKEKYPNLQCVLDIYDTTSTTNIIKNSQYNGISNMNCIAALCDIAYKNHIFLSIGGFPEKRFINNNICISNTHFIISPQGQISSKLYRKIHLFDAPVVGLKESNTTVAGDEIVRTAVGGWSVGLSICYDLRFPELYQALCTPSTSTNTTTAYTTSTASTTSNTSNSIDNNYDIYKDMLISSNRADIILIPSAFTVLTGKSHWEILLRARAIETQCYIIAAAQSGIHNEKRSSYGHTIIVDPWGNIVGQLGDEDEGILCAELDLDYLCNIRVKMPVQNHKRKDIY